MTLEHLRAEAREKFRQLPQPAIFPAALVNHEKQIEALIDTLIEHTHTQTIQSVRERIKDKIWVVQATDDAHRFYQVKDHNHALEDLLKDLEAPVEGDGV